MSNSKLRPTLPTVAVVFDSNQIKTFFGNHYIRNNANNLYIDLSDGILVNDHCLSNNGFEEMTINEGLYSDRKTFFRKYIDMIGELSNDNNTREWWGSQLASKNRFASQLPELLIKYVKCANVIKDKSFDNLLILSTDPILLNPFRKIIKQNGIESISLKRYPFPFNNSNIINFFRLIINLKNKSSASLRSIKLVINQYLTLSKKITYVRKNLNPELIGKLNDDKTYFLIKTFAYKRSFEKNGRFIDLFFGQLHEYLQKRGEVVTLVDILDKYEEIITKINSTNNAILIPYEYFLSRWDGLVSLLKLLFWRCRINKIKFFGYDVSEIIKLELKRSGVSLNQYMYYYCIKNLLKTISVNQCFLTYENIAWENMFILAFRDFSPKTRIIGSQHAVVPMAAAGMFTSKSDSRIKPIPDRILTTGEVPKNILLKYGAYTKDMIVPSCALRFEYLSAFKGKKRNQIRNILLALEGILDVHKMVNYTLRELSHHEKFNLIIRTHPLLSWEKIESRITFDISKLSNVSISTNPSILDDLANTDVCIYWGSTVALEALSIGIPVIYFDMNTVLDYDPLFELKNLKWVVGENDSLDKVIMQINGLSDDEYQYQVGRAQEYIDRYFHPVTEENLGKFLHS